MTDRPSTSSMVWCANQGPTRIMDMTTPHLRNLVAWLDRHWDTVSEPEVCWDVLDYVPPSAAETNHRALFDACLRELRWRDANWNSHTMVPC